MIERAYPRGGFANGEALMDAFSAVVAEAAPEEQLDLVRRHPELADKTAIDTRSLTAESASEQAGAGLDRLTPAEYETFHALNRAYRERFGFPFVICVRLHDKAGILRALRARAAGDADELATAGLTRLTTIPHGPAADSIDRPLPPGRRPEGLTRLNWECLAPWPQD